MTQDILPTWGILGMVGKRRVAGYIEEARIAGVPLLRMDIPTGERGPASDEDVVEAFVPVVNPLVQYYSLTAVSELTPVSEDTARAIAEEMALDPITPGRSSSLGVPQDYRGFLDILVRNRPAPPELQSFSRPTPPSA